VHVYAYNNTETYVLNCIHVHTYKCKYKYDNLSHKCHKKYAMTNDSYDEINERWANNFVTTR